MAGTVSFHDIAPRQTVGLIAGEGERRVRLSALVTAAGSHRVALALRVLPLHAALIAPGAPLAVVLPGGGVVDACVERLDTGGTAVLVIRAAVPPESAANQRAYFRVPMRLLGTPATLLAGGTAACFRVHLMDLSGGGARVLSPRPLAGGATLNLRVPVFDGPDLQVMGRVTRVHSVRRSWEAAVEFTGLAEAERDRIVRIVFRAELARRQVR